MKNYSGYVAGERDFRNISIKDSRKGLFQRVDLSDINLEGSFINVDLSGAILRNANLQNFVWGSGGWQDVDLSDSNLTGVSNQDSFVFTHCNFSGTTWTQVNFFQSTFIDCDLR